MIAQEAREMAKRQIKKEMESVLKQIELAANNGEFMIEIDGDSNYFEDNHVYCLEQLGYDVEYNRFLYNWKIK